MTEKKPLIVCIVGSSGAGKTSVAEYLDSVYGLKMIESYTTRAPRFEGERGHTFVSEEEFNTFKREYMIAYTEFGDTEIHRYCCLTKDILPQNSYVIDEKGLIYLKENFSDIYNIKSMWLSRDEQKRRASGVDEKRIARDRTMFNSENFYLYDIIINSDYELPEVFKSVDEFVESFLK